jgi:hypothetical protein
MLGKFRLVDLSAPLEHQAASGSATPQAGGE